MRVNQTGWPSSCVLGQITFVRRKGWLWLQARDASKNSVNAAKLADGATGRPRQGGQRAGIEQPPSRVPMVARLGQFSRQERFEVVWTRRPPPRAASGLSAVLVRRIAARHQAPLEPREARSRALRLPPRMSWDRGQVRGHSKFVLVRRGRGRRERSWSACLGVPIRVGTGQVVAGTLTALSHEPPRRRRSPTSRSRTPTVVRGSFVNLVRDGPPMPDREDQTAALIGLQFSCPLVRTPALAPSQLARTRKVRSLRGGRHRRTGRLASDVTVGRWPQVRSERKRVGQDAAGLRRRRRGTPRSDEQLPPAGGNPADEVQRVVGLRRIGRTTPAVRLVDSSHR